MTKQKLKINKQKIDRILKKIQPILKRHGGGVKVKSVTGNKIKLEVLGVCRGCSAIDVTFDRVIIGMIKKEIPEAEVEYS